MYCISEKNAGLLSTADNAVPVSPGGVDGSKVDRNGRRSGRVPPPGLSEMTPLKVERWHNRKNNVISGFTKNLVLNTPIFIDTSSTHPTAGVVNYACTRSFL